MPHIVDGNAIWRGCLVLVAAVVLLAIGSAQTILLGSGLLAGAGWWIVSGIGDAGIRGKLLRFLWIAGWLLTLATPLGLRRGADVGLVLGAVGFAVLAFLLRDVFKAEGLDKLAQQWSRNLFYVTAFMLVPLAVEIPIAVVNGLPDPNTTTDELSVADAIFVAVVILVLIATVHIVFTLYRTIAARSQYVDRAEAEPA